MYKPQILVEATGPYSEKGPEFKAIYHAHAGLVWARIFKGMLDIRAYRRARLYAIECAINSLGRAFAHCNRIDNLETRAHFRASITRQRNWLAAEKRKAERSTHEHF